MEQLEKRLRWIDLTNEWVGNVISYFVAVMALLIIIEVVMRYFLNAPTTWCNELTQMIFGAYSVLAGGYVLLCKKHVNADILSSRLPKRVQILIDIITAPLFFFFCGVLLYYGGSYAWESLIALETTRSAWDPPAYPIKLMIPLGALLLLLQGIALLIRNIATLVRGQGSVASTGREGGEA